MGLTKYHRKRGITMTKFETVGVSYQHLAENKSQAEKSFQHSCHCCCNKGMRLDCDKCAIAQVHGLVIAAFDTMA